MPKAVQSLLDTAKTPWIPLGPGESFKLLRILSGERGRALLLRLEPGTLVPKHRHLGEVHAYNLEGSRHLIEADRIAGPGSYVYEPSGNVDSWRAVGEAPCVVHIIAHGAMEYLDERGQVTRRDTAESLLELYLNDCEKNGLRPIDIG